VQANAKGETAKTTAAKRAAGTLSVARRTIRKIISVDSTATTSISVRPVFTEVPKARKPPTNLAQAPI